MKKKVNKKKIRQVVEEVYEQDYGKFGGKQDFLTDLFALQQKYPECYIEAWTPEDYSTVTQQDFPVHRLSIGQCEIVSSNLYNYADANEGTTWDKVKHFVNKTIKEYENA